MLRRFALVALLLAVLAPKAQALGGFGLQGGLYTPTNKARDLLNSEWQVGLRALLPPVSPLGVINVQGLSLDVGLDLGVKQAKQIAAINFDTQLLNLTAIYRLTIPLGDSAAVYLGLGGRVSAVWGELSKDLRDGSLFGHLRGSMAACGGLDYALSPGMFLDARLGYGVFGFTSWEAMGGLLFAM